MSDADPRPGAAEERPTTTLVLQEGIGQTDVGTACLPHFGIDDPESAALVRVAYTGPVAAFLDAFTDEFGGLPATASVVLVQGVAAGTTESLPDDVAVGTVNPNDLTGLAMRLRDALERVSATGHHPVVCFDSVTSLLQYHDIEAAYRFLHMFVGQLEEVDAVAHFHLQRQAHDDQHVHTLQGMFDRVVEAGD